PDTEADMWLRPIPEPDQRVPGHMDVLLPRRNHPATVMSWREFLLNPLMLTLVFGCFAISLIGTAWAQNTEPQQSSIIAVLIRWTPLLAQGFTYNILISLLSMALGTVLGVLLGILQVSP